MDTKSFFAISKVTRVIAVITAVFLVLGTARFFTVAAQTATAAASTPQPSAPNHAQQLNDLRNTYHGQLTQYRDDERNYTIAREQYAQLQTLASLEEAVKGTRKVMISRATLLETYYQMLLLSMDSATGVEVPLKNDQLQLLDSVYKGIKAHRANVEKASDRTSIDAMELEFAELARPIQLTAYRTLMMIAYGRAQSLYDNTLVVSRDFASQIDEEEKNPLVLAEKWRGFEEIGRTLRETDAQLKELEGTLKGDDKSFTESTYNRFTENLQEVYGSLSRTITYLDEIIKK